MATSMKYVDILMVGKTGNGKSALGNMILQNPKAFISRNDLESVTKTTQFEYSEFEGTYIKIVDGPGVGDTEKDKAEGVRLVAEAMQHAVMTSLEGFHAILIVVRYGGRYTSEDVQTIQTLKHIFGETFITNHGILVMTCGDQFEKDAQDEKKSETFEQWCQKQTGIFSELLREVNNRVMLFNNRATGKACYEQIRRLLHMIEGQCRSGTRYTSAIFKDAQLQRDRLMVESKRPFLQENAIREAGLIHQLLGRLDHGNPENELGHLNNLKTRAETLHQTVIQQDNGTNALSYAIKLTENMVNTITYQLETLKKAIELREEAEDLRRKYKEVEGKRLLEEKKREEQRKREEEKEKRRREEDECRLREEKKEIEKILTEMKNEREKLESLRGYEEKRRLEEQQQKLAELQDAEKRREKQRKRDEDARQREDDKRQQERKKVEEDLRQKIEALEKEIERMGQESQKKLEMKMKEMRKEQKKMKEEERKGFFGATKDLGIALIMKLARLLG